MPEPINPAEADAAMMIALDMYAHLGTAQLWRRCVLMHRETSERSLSESYRLRLISYRLALVGRGFTADQVEMTAVMDPEDVPTPVNRPIGKIWRAERGVMGPGGCSE